jgi:hypothetical protein
MSWTQRFILSRELLREPILFSLRMTLHVRRDAVKIQMMIRFEMRYQSNGRLMRIFILLGNMGEALIKIEE